MIAGRGGCWYAGDYGAPREGLCRRHCCVSGGITPLQC
jgi:hypothetical protein